MIDQSFTQRFLQRPLVLVLGVVLWCFAALWSPYAECQEGDEELAKRIEELEARVAELEEEQSEPNIEPVVLAKNKNLRLTLGGRIHRMIQVVDDTLATDAFFTDSEQGPTALKLHAEAVPSDRLSIAAILEVAIQQNRPFKVNQEEPNPGIDITGRIAEITFEGPGFGKFSLGRGFAAAWLSPEIDLSGTQYAALLPVGTLAPGMLFVDATTNQYSDIVVGTYFIDVERLLIIDRLRWDSPRIAGLQLSGSIAADSRWDTALRANYTPGPFTLVAGGSYQNNPFEGIETRYDGAVSARHEPTGLNLTVGASMDDLAGGDTATTWIVKAGWLADLVSLGKTAFSLDHYRVSDLRVDGDRGTSWGFFAMQKWPTYGLDFYVGVRRYEVSDTSLDLEPLFVVPVGVVFNF